MFSKKSIVFILSFVFVSFVSAQNNIPDTLTQAKQQIAQEAKRCNSYYVNHHWLGGMLTNWITLESRIKRLRELEEQEANQIFELLPKKEASIRKKELEKLKQKVITPNSF